MIKLRASQINGCAYCVDMHTKDADAMGEDAQRLHLVAVWREAPVFSPRERAALAWTEALTLLSETGAPDDVYEEVARQFGPEEQVALTLAIVAINGWNRLAVGFRQPVGAYVSHLHPIQPEGHIDGKARRSRGDNSESRLNRPRRLGTPSTPRSGPSMPGGMRSSISSIHSIKRTSSGPATTATPTGRSPIWSRTWELGWPRPGYSSDKSKPARISRAIWTSKR